jgi:ABC-type amino acid transport substrate-binding protein
MEPAYLFLARKNADLAPKIASAFKELKQNGTYRKVFGMDP